MNKNKLNQIIETHCPEATEYQTSLICSDIRLEIDRLYDQSIIDYFKKYNTGPKSAEDFLEFFKLTLNKELLRP